MRARTYLLTAALTALLAGCGGDKEENNDNRKYPLNSSRTQHKISITRPGLPEEYPYATGTPAAVVVSYSGSGYLLYVNGTKLDLANSRRVSALEAQGLLVSRLKMQESGYRTGTSQLGRDAVAITSLYPGNLAVIAQDYNDGSKDSTNLSFEGECLFLQPPLAAREDTLGFEAKSASKATGKRVANTLEALGAWVSGKLGEAKTEIGKWKGERDKEKGGKGGSS